MRECLPEARPAWGGLPAYPVARVSDRLPDEIDAPQVAKTDADAANWAWQYRTGAAFTTFVVNTPAARAGRSERNSARSFFPGTAEMPHRRPQRR